MSVSYSSFHLAPELFFKGGFFSCAPPLFQSLSYTLHEMVFLYHFFERKVNYKCVVKRSNLTRNKWCLSWILCLLLGMKPSQPHFNHNYTAVQMSDLKNGGVTQDMSHLPEPLQVSITLCISSYPEAPSPSRTYVKHAFSIIQLSPDSWRFRFYEYL